MNETQIRVRAIKSSAIRCQDAAAEISSIARSARDRPELARHIPRLAMYAASAASLGRMVRDMAPISGAGSVARQAAADADYMLTIARTFR